MSLKRSFGSLTLKYSTVSDKGANLEAQMNEICDIPCYWLGNREEQLRPSGDDELSLHCRCSNNTSKNDSVSFEVTFKEQNKVGCFRSTSTKKLFKNLEKKFCRVFSKITSKVCLHEARLCRTIIFMTLKVPSVCDCCVEDIRSLKLQIFMNSVRNCDVNLWSRSKIITSGRRR